MPMFQIPGVRWCAEVPEVPVRELRLSGRFHRCSARLFRFDFTVENAGTQPVRVPRLPLLRLAEPCLPFPFERCVVTRLARQKNDVPGPFHPARVDAALRNAAFDSSEIIAGGGVAWCEMEEKETLPHSFHCDPGLALSDEAGTFHCFIGFDGQTRHLSDLVVESDEARSRLVAVTATVEFDAVVLAPGETLRPHSLYLDFGTDSVRELMLRHARRVARTTGTLHSPCRNIYCTWYYYGADIDRREVLANLRFIDREHLPFDVFQIDMGWENCFGDWEAEEVKFPGGMARVARAIRRRGILPGLWCAPFVVEEQAEVVRQNPEMFLRNSAGEFCRFQCVKGACRVVDPFHPAAEAYLVSLFRKFRRWGYGYFKLDFLRAVFLTADARFHDPGKNRAQAYRHGLELIRAGVGEDGVIDACGGLYEGSAGLVNLVRSGFDLRGHWRAEDSEISAYVNRIAQNLHRNFYNELWSTDPDALQLRRNDRAWKDNPLNLHLSRGCFTDEEAFSIVVNQLIGGGVVCVSERFRGFDPDRLALLKWLLPRRRFPAAIPPVLEAETLPRMLYCRSRGALLIVLNNWLGEETAEVPLHLEWIPRVIPGERYELFDCRNACRLGECVAGNPFPVRIPAHGTALLRALRRRKPTAGEAEAE